MTVQPENTTPEGGENNDANEYSFADGDILGALSFLSPDLGAEEDSSPAASTGEATATSGDGSQEPAAPAEGATGGDEPAEEPGAGTPGVDGAGVGGVVETGTEFANPSGTFEASTLEETWGGIATGIEERHREELEREAFAEVKKEYSGYFDLLNKHPREAVGDEVPSLTDPNRMETLRDSSDAKDYQEAVKARLTRMVAERARAASDEVRPVMNALHDSVALFQTNPELVPNSKQFDSEIAKQFVAMVKPYELKIEDKIVGYNMNVQPIFEQVKAQVLAARAAAKPTPRQEQAAQQERNQKGEFAPPQASLVGSAGSAGGEKTEDYSTLLGAFNLGDLKF